MPRPQSSPNSCLPPSTPALPPLLLQHPSHSPALQSGCQSRPFKDIPEGVVSVTSARGMNEQERVLTQLPLRTWGRRVEVVGGGQERGVETCAQTVEIAGSEGCGMELRAASFCLALLWGCSLAAAAAQGKEGECLRGGRGHQGSRATGPRTLEPHAALRGASLETDLWMRGLGALSSGRARRLRSGTVLGTPPLGS